MERKLVGKGEWRAKKRLGEPTDQGVVPTLSEGDGDEKARWHVSTAVLSEVWQGCLGIFHRKVPVRGVLLLPGMVLP